VKASLALGLGLAAVLLLAAAYLRTGNNPPPAAEGSAPTAGPSAAAQPASGLALPAQSLAQPGGWAPRSAEQLARAPQAELIDQVRQLRACHDADRCDFDESDSRAAHFAAANAMSMRLKALLPQAADPAVVALARAQLDFPNGQVQAAALALLASQRPDPALTQQVLQMLAGNHDAPLLEAALPLLAQWQAQGQPATDATLQNLLRTGPHFVGLTLSTPQSLLPFLTDANLPQYQALLRELPESRKREQLQQTLTEYQRLRAGG
jgi:hypothetical protein